MNITESIKTKRVRFVDANSRIGYTSLADMEHGIQARNNCYNASNAVAVKLGQDGHDASVIGLLFKSAEHWATMVYPANESDPVTVIDYTMRQFAVGAGISEEKIPFPFIASYEDWKATVEGWAAARWDEELQDVENLIAE